MRTQTDQPLRDGDADLRGGNAGKHSEEQERTTEYRFRTAVRRGHCQKLLRRGHPHAGQEGTVRQTHRDGAHAQNLGGEADLQLHEGAQQRRFAAGVKVQRQKAGDLDLLGVSALRKL